MNDAGSKSADHKSEERITELAHAIWDRAGRPEGRFEECKRLARFELDVEGAHPQGEGTQILTKDGIKKLPPGEGTA